jgi:hypothetical protein
MSEIKLNDVLQKIDEYKESWREYIPDGEFDWFVDRVKTAIKIFYDLPDPAVISAELKRIEKASRRPTREFVNLINNASSATRTVLEEHGGLLVTPNAGDENAIVDFAREIRSRIILTTYWKAEGTKQRRKVKVITERPFKRPKHHRLDALVSLVAAAYGGVTGKATSRSWSDDKKKPIQVVLGDIFNALAIDDYSSDNEALRRHIATRNSLEQNP